MMMAISAEMQDSLHQLARLRGQNNVIDALRKAVAVDLFLMKQLRDGGALYVKDKSGQLREVKL